MNRFVIQKCLLILLLLEDSMDWVLFTLSTTCFIKANVGEKLSSQTRRLFFFSNVPVMWCKSTCLGHSWVSDQISLIGINMQRLYLKVTPWLTCRREETINYVPAQPPHPFLESFKYRTGSNNQNFEQWTHKYSLLSKCTNQFPAMTKAISLSVVHKTLSSSSANV